jgi:hypothetical protein
MYRNPNVTAKTCFFFISIFDYLVVSVKGCQFLGVASRMSYYQPITQHITQFIQTNNTRAFVFGGALGYAVSNGFWHHTPLILLNPVGYSAYQLFVSRSEVVKWCKQSVPLS